MNMPLNTNNPLPLLSLSQSLLASHTALCLSLRNTYFRPINYHRQHRSEAYVFLLTFFDVPNKVCRSKTEKKLS